MINLLKCIDKKSAFGDLCRQVAAKNDMPESTVFLTGLAIFSSMACRHYHVTYEDGAILPIGLYVLLEHPPGTGKSPVINVFKQPFYDIYNDSDSESTLFVSNATPEAIEVTMNNQNGTNGFFSAVSAEQGLVNTLFGFSYGNGVNNNDVVLHGFDGGWHESIRVKRDGYTGRVSGGICAFSQEGTIGKILEISNGTGIADRFLMLSEQSKLGNRDHVAPKPIINGVFNKYENSCQFLKKVLSNSKRLNQTTKLSIEPQSYISIAKMRQSIEPNLVDGGALSDSFLRGAAAKCQMQVMKLAANLTLLDGVGSTDILGQTTIPHSYVLSAIAIAESLLYNLVELAAKTEYLGAEAEEAAIISYFVKRNKSKILWRELYNSMRNTKPFKEMSGDKSNVIKAALTRMILDGKLLLTKDNFYQII